jgi:endonuclease V-like protein UPF0215 family
LAGVTISNVIGFDDYPFQRTHRGDVGVVGAVYSGNRLDGIVSGRVRRDGTNATRSLVDLVRYSKFAPQVQLVMLQGIALAGFNVLDIHEMHKSLNVPVLVVARRAPHMESIREALLSHVRGGRHKWALIQKAGAMEPVEGVFVQRAGLTLEEAAEVIRRFAAHGNIPEPLRVAHLIAGGIATGESKGRP